MITQQKSLEANIQAYGSGFAHIFDNKVVLNWYPTRIMARVDPGLSLLELGIGHGYTTVRFSEYFTRHVVVEGARSVINQFRIAHPVCIAEIEETLFEKYKTDERFDVIVMGFVLEHVDDPVMILQHFRKFNAPGGRCFIAVPNGESLHRRIGKAAGLLEDMMALGAGDVALGHKRLYSVENLKKDIQAGGYRIKRLEGIFLKPFSTAQLEGLLLGQKILKALCHVGIDYPELSCAILAEIEARTP